MDIASPSGIPTPSDDQHKSIYQQLPNSSQNNDASTRNVSLVPLETKFSAALEREKLLSKQLVLKDEEIAALQEENSELENFNKRYEAQRESHSSLLAIGAAARNYYVERQKQKFEDQNIHELKGGYSAVDLPRPLADARLYRDGLRSDAQMYVQIYGVEWPVILECGLGLYTRLIQYYASVKQLHPGDFPTTEFYTFWKRVIPQGFWYLDVQQAKSFCLTDSAIAEELKRLWNEEANTDFKQKCSMSAKEKPISVGTPLPRSERTSPDTRSSSAQSQPDNSLSPEFAVKDEHLQSLSHLEIEPKSKIHTILKDDSTVEKKDLESVQLVNNTTGDWKDGLLRVGIVVRQRHQEHLRPGALRNKEIMEVGNEAAHYGNALADAALFHPEVQSRLSEPRLRYSRLTEIRAADEVLFINRYLLPPMDVLRLARCKKLLQMLDWRGSVYAWHPLDYKTTPFYKNFPSILESAIRALSKNTVEEVEVMFGEGKFLSEVIKKLEAKYLTEAELNRRRQIERVS